MENHMKGLELCLNYFNQIGEPLLQDRFPSQWPRIAAGLVGRGSDCFGFDDDYSRDHDWGPAFSLWLTEEDMSSFGKELSLAYEGLPGHFLGYQVCNSPARQTGVRSIGQFYSELLGDQAASMLLQRHFDRVDFWLSTPEEQLAAAVSGSVFRDPTGQFSAIRQALMQYYPKDIQQEKLAAYCLEAGKSGQFVYLRSLSRGEIMAANGSLQRFCEAVCRIICILNRRFCPRYKWLFRAISQMPVLGSALAPSLESLCRNGGMPQDGDLKAIAEKQSLLIEQICVTLSDQLRSQGFSQTAGHFLAQHGTAMLQ